MECFTSEHPRKAFSIRDNLTTLMFIVASDLREAQRERERDSQVRFLFGESMSPLALLNL